MRESHNFSTEVAEYLFMSRLIFDCRLRSFGRSSKRSVMFFAMTSGLEVSKSTPVWLVICARAPEARESARQGSP